MGWELLFNWGNFRIDIFPSRSLLRFDGICKLTVEEWVCCLFCSLLLANNSKLKFWNLLSANFKGIVIIRSCYLAYQLSDYTVTLVYLLKCIRHKSLIKVSARVQNANFRNFWFRDVQIKLFKSFLLKKIYKKILLHVNCFNYSLTSPVILE